MTPPSTVPTLKGRDLTEASFTVRNPRVDRFQECPYIHTLCNVTLHFVPSKGSPFLHILVLGWLC